MNRRKINPVFIIIVLFYFSTSYSQQVSVTKQFHRGSTLDKQFELVNMSSIPYLLDNSIRNTDKKFKNEPSENYKGTPYGFPSYLLGNVYMNDSLIYNNVALRYNVIEDEVEVKKSLQSLDENAMALLKSPSISVMISENKYIFIPKGKGLINGGYVQVLTRGTNISLYKKLEKYYSPAKKAKNTFESDLLPTFKDHIVYYIYFSNGGMIELPKQKNKKFKTFGKSEKKIKAYAKEYKLDINDEEDLKRIIIYLDNYNDASL